MGRLLVAAAAPLLLFVGSGVAHADDGAYLNIMRNSPGVIGGPVNEAIYVSQGHRACDILHTGQSTEAAVNQLTVPIYVQPWLARAMVTAAQTAICPDTLPPA